MYRESMYTGTMIEDLIAAVERAEMHARYEYDPVEILQPEESELPLAYLIERSYSEPMAGVA